MIVAIPVVDDGALGSFSGHSKQLHITISKYTASDGVTDSDRLEKPGLFCVGLLSEGSMLLSNRMRR